MTTSGNIIHAKVIYVSLDTLVLRYTHDNRPYDIELPRTKKNSFLKIGDEIEMQMLIITENEEEVDDDNESNDGLYCNIHGNTDHSVDCE